MRSTRTWTLVAFIAASRRLEPVQRRAAMFSIVLSAFLLSSLSPASAGPKPVKSLLEMRRENVVIQQWDLSCGAAALATILNHQHGDSVSEREVARGLMARDAYLADPSLIQRRQGFSLFDLKRYVDGRGYNGVGLGQLTLEDLVTRAPIMVPVNLDGYNHFVVFRGRFGNRVLLADPAFGNRTMLADRFEEAWLDYPDFGKVGFVVERRDGHASFHGLIARRDDFVMLR